MLTIPPIIVACDRASQLNRGSRSRGDVKHARYVRASVKSSCPLVSPQDASWSPQSLKGSAVTSLSSSLRYHGARAPVGGTRELVRAVPEGLRGHLPPLHDTTVPALLWAARAHALLGLLGPCRAQIEVPEGLRASLRLKYNGL